MMSRSDHHASPPTGTTPEELEGFALFLCASYSRLQDVNPPYVAKAFVWHGVQYIYVAGWDTDKRRRLLEVFQKTKDTLIEPILAFQYPLPIRDLFPEDYNVLYSDDPWGELDRSMTL